MQPECISVIMPTYNQSEFIAMAINSLIQQTFTRWELIIINDGSTDLTYENVQIFLTDKRISYYKNLANRGLGAALNSGIEMSKYNLIAYLPSDDVYFKTHLETLVSKMEKNADALITYADMIFNYTDGPKGSFNQNTSFLSNYGFQLVQVLHRKTKDRWLERNELVTDDLDRMFWSKLTKNKPPIASGKVTCEWITHPLQRHKIITETGQGGIYAYKKYYQVKEPIKFQSSVGNFIDEAKIYKPLIKLKTTPQKQLKILIVGELSYNPERILAFEQHGHKLFGLWDKSPYVHNTVGPLPFGSLTDINSDTAINTIQEIRPDIIYALLDHNVIPLAYNILSDCPDIPFIWHFKESPFYARQSGYWKELIYLYANSDGRIFNNEETKRWFSQFLTNVNINSYVLDGELAKIEWFTYNKAPLLSDLDGEIHTVIPGRPLGLLPIHLSELAEQKIHIHFYGNVNHYSWHKWIIESKKQAKEYLHIHPNVNPVDWVREFSKYDAGWLHYFDSENNGELAKIRWNDLNYPVRMCTLAAAGLPMIQKNNADHIVATQSITTQYNIGLFFNTFQELGLSLKNKTLMTLLRNNVWKQRHNFSFDFHLPGLLEFFTNTIERKINQ